MLTKPRTLQAGSTVVATNLRLTAGVGRVLVDDHLVDLAEFAEILRLLQHVLITQPWTQPHHKDQVPLHHADVSQVFSETNSTI